MNDNPYLAPNVENPVLPRFMKVASQFDVGKGLTANRNFGHVIASRDAMYLISLKSGKEMSFSIAGLVIGVPVGTIFISGWASYLVCIGVPLLFGAVGYLVEIFYPTPLLPGQIDFNDIPADVTQHADWPLTKLGKWRAFIVRRADVISTRNHAIHTYNIETKTGNFGVAFSLVNRQAAISFLRENDWAV